MSLPPTIRPVPPRAADSTIDRPSDSEARQLAEWDHAHLWHPFTAQAAWLAEEPLVIDRAEGMYLYDTHGNRYIDGVSSLWCNVHGHQHPALDRAIRDQLEKAAHTTLLGLSHPAAIRLARRLAELAPAGLTRVFFSDSGANAVEVALKIAFQYWRQIEQPEPQRDLFLGLKLAYHGDTLGDVSLGGVDVFHDMFRPLLFPTLRAPAPYCYRCPLSLRRPECGMACLAEVEKLLAANPGRVAAVVIEPIVQGASGMIVQPPGYLAGLSELTRRYKTLLIADEVAVGFGRTGTLFACEQEQVVPDILCVAKGITGGYLPLSATLTNDTIHAAFVGDSTHDKTFFHGHTYGGNPLAAAVALASLDLFEQERVLPGLGQRVALMASKLERIGRHPHVGDVRQKGMMVGIELVADKATGRPFDPGEKLGARVCRQARKYGIVIRPLGDVVVLMPPLSIPLEVLDELLAGVSTSIADVTQCPMPE